PVGAVRARDLLAHLLAAGSALVRLFAVLASDVAVAVLAPDASVAVPAPDASARFLIAVVSLGAVRARDRVDRCSACSALVRPGAALVSAAVSVALSP